MKLVAIMPARNEDWILRLSARAVLDWCDAIVLLDHSSWDETPEIIRELEEEFPERILTRVRGGEWAEMNHRQDLLEAGRLIGGTHFALIDADELLTANLVPRVREVIQQLEPGQALDVPMLAPWGSLEEYRVDDCVWTRAMLTIAFRDMPGLSWHPREDGYQHHHRLPFGASPQRMRFGGPWGGMHLQFADRRRLLAKHALYKIQEVLRWPGREPVGAVDWKYSQALDETGLKLAPCPDAWWAGYDKGLIGLGRVPWQEEEVARVVREHGEGRFEGLELWGLR